jgi:autotransporter-associated beta strand protein
MTSPKTSSIAKPRRAAFARSPSAFAIYLTPCAAAIQLLLASSAWAVTIDAVTVTTPDNAGIGGAAAEAVTMQNNGTLRNTATFTTTRAFTLQPTGGTLSTDAATALTISGVIDGPGGTLTKTGAGTLIMTGANTYGGGTTVTAGTLQGNAASLQGNIVNNGTVVFNQTGSTGTYAGTLSGTGGVKFTGDGNAVIVTGTNSYQGGTVIDGGVMSITADANLGAAAGAVSISNSGGLNISTNNFTTNRSLSFTGDANISMGLNTVTWAGDIAGTGKLIQSGNAQGTLILTGNNSYNGIEIVTGTLEGNTASLRGDVAVTGALSTIRFNQAANDTYTGSITGAGKLTKTGVGTLILTGANNYTGGTTVTTGRLQGDSASLQGAIVNNAGVVFDQATTGTYAGAMSGTGRLIKTGAGTLIMTGANTYGGNTDVTAGTLNVTGSLAPASAVSVAGGAILGGSGSVGATSVASGGTLSAGGAGTIGTLTLNGNYTPAAGSNLRAYFDAANASRVNVNGVVTGINNATVQMRAANGAPVVAGGYTLNKQYTVLSSTGGITGALPSVNSDLTFLTFTPSFQNAGNDLAVTINAIAAAPVPPVPIPPVPVTPVPPGPPLTTAFTQHALNESQRAAAVALDANLSGMPAQALLATTGVTAGYALQSVSGHQYGATSHIVQSRLQQVQQSIDRQQRCQDAGGTGTNTAGATDGMDGSGCQNIWAEAGSDNFRLQEDGASPGVRSSGNHFALGVQHNFGDGWSGGLMLGRSNANADYGNALGDGKVTGTQIGAYAKWSVDGRYVSASLVGGHERYSIHRDLRGSGVRATGEYGGSSLGANVEAGFTGSPLGEISVQPFLGLAITEVKRDGVRETGAGNLNLNIAANRDTAITTQLGVRFGGSLGTGSENWYVQPGWKHSFERASSRVDASFAADGSTAFGYDAARPKRDALALEAGLQGGVDKNVSWFASASIQTGNRAEALRLSGGLKAKW